MTELFIGIFPLFWLISILFFDQSNFTFQLLYHDWLLSIFSNLDFQILPFTYFLLILNKCQLMKMRALFSSWFYLFGHMRHFLHHFTILRFIWKRPVCLVKPIIIIIITSIQLNSLIHWCVVSFMIIWYQGRKISFKRAWSIFVT